MKRDDVVCVVGVRLHIRRHDDDLDGRNIGVQLVDCDEIGVEGEMRELGVHGFLFWRSGNERGIYYHIVALGRHFFRIVDFENKKGVELLHRFRIMEFSS